MRIKCIHFEQSKSAAVVDGHHHSLTTVAQGIARIYSAIDINRVGLA
jgi:hypothetical protein